MHDQLYTSLQEAHLPTQSWHDEWQSVTQQVPPKFSLQLKLHDILMHPAHNVHALQYPLQVKHPVQLAQLPVQPLLQLLVQLLTQLLQLDAHLKVKVKEK